MSGETKYPAGWREASITELCSPHPHSLRRGPFGSAIRKDCFVPSGFKVYEQQHAIQEDFAIGRYYIDKPKFEELSAFRVSPGDVIVSCAGTIGKIAVVPDWAEPGIINQALLKITLNPSVVVRTYFVYLFKFLSSKLSSRGTGMQNLAGVKELKKVRFPLPALPEQRRIVAEIEKQLTRLDSGVTALKRVQANLNRYRAAVLKAACEGRLVPTEAELRRAGKAPDFESGADLLKRVLVERRKSWNARGKYKEPAEPETANLPEVPQGWTRANIAQVSVIVQYGSSAKTGAYPNGVPVLRMGNIQDGKFDFESLKYLPKKHNEFPDLLLAERDLLFNRTNSAENTLKRSDLDEFVKCYNPKNRHERKATWSEKNAEGRWRAYEYGELLKRDKLNLDIFWLRDESVEDSANLPDPHIIAEEITQDLEAALEQFATIAEDLKKK